MPRPSGTPSVLHEKLSPPETCSLPPSDVYICVYTVYVCVCVDVEGVGGYLGVTHFHLVCEPPCGPDLAPYLGLTQTWGVIDRNGKNS